MNEKRSNGTPSLDELLKSQAAYHSERAGNIEHLRKIDWSIDAAFDTEFKAEAERDLQKAADLARLRRGEARSMREG